MGKPPGTNTRNITSSSPSQKRTSISRTPPRVDTHAVKTSFQVSNKINRKQSSNDHHSQNRRMPSTPRADDSENDDPSSVEKNNNCDKGGAGNNKKILEAAVDPFSRLVEPFLQPQSISPASNSNLNWMFWRLYSRHIHSHLERHWSFNGTYLSRALLGEMFHEKMSDVSVPYHKDIYFEAIKITNIGDLHTRSPKVKRLRIEGLRIQTADDHKSSDDERKRLLLASDSLADLLSLVLRVDDLIFIFSDRNWVMETKVISLNAKGQGSLIAHYRHDGIFAASGMSEGDSDVVEDDDDFVSRLNGNDFQYIYQEHEDDDEMVVKVHPLFFTEHSDDNNNNVVEETSHQNETSVRDSSPVPSHDSSSSTSSPDHGRVASAVEREVTSGSDSDSDSDAGTDLSTLNRKNNHLSTAENRESCNNEINHSIHSEENPDDNENKQNSQIESVASKEEEEEGKEKEDAQNQNHSQIDSESSKEEDKEDNENKNQNHSQIVPESSNEQEEEDEDTITEAATVATPSSTTLPQNKEVLSGDEQMRTPSPSSASLMVAPINSGGTEYFSCSPTKSPDQKQELLSQSQKRKRKSASSSDSGSESSDSDSDSSARKRNKLNSQPSAFPSDVDVIISVMNEDSQSQESDSDSDDENPHNAGFTEEKGEKQSLESGDGHLNDEQSTESPMQVISPPDPVIGEAEISQPQSQPHSDGGYLQLGTQYELDDDEDDEEEQEEEVIAANKSTTQSDTSSDESDDDTSDDDSQNQQQEQQQPISPTSETSQNSSAVNSGDSGMLSALLDNNDSDSDSDSDSDADSFKSAISNIQRSSQSSDNQSEISSQHGSGSALQDVNVNVEDEAEASEASRDSHMNKEVDNITNCFVLMERLKASDFENCKINGLTPTVVVEVVKPPKKPVTRSTRQALTINGQGSQRTLRPRKGNGRWMQGK